MASSLSNPLGPTIKHVLAEAEQGLQGHPFIALDAEVLLAHVLGASRSYLHTWPEQRLSDMQLAQFYALLERRRRGEPVAYLTGESEFWSLPLRVTPDTLIPRPETELLVEEALARIPLDAVWQLADLGTGSGAIALALAHERPRCRIMATDTSVAALQVAQANALSSGFTHIEFSIGDENWCRPLHGKRLNMIISNPPYIRAGDAHLDELRFEPRSALEAGADGLSALREIATQARHHLLQDGWLLLEHGFDQGPALVELLSGLGYQQVQDYCDLAGISRVTAAQYRG